MLACSNFEPGAPYPTSGDQPAIYRVSDGVQVHRTTVPGNVGTRALSWYSETQALVQVDGIWTCTGPLGTTSYTTRLYAMDTATGT
ncbi:MAG: hypothetical protein ACRCYU_03405, partial [Nocardioides sp.]